MVGGGGQQDGEVGVGTLCAPGPPSLAPDAGEIRAADLSIRELNFRIYNIFLER